MATTAKTRTAGGQWTPGVAARFSFDGFIAFAAMYVAYEFSPYVSELSAGDSAAHLGQIKASVMFGLLTAIASHVFRLHDPLLPRLFWPMAIRCVGAVALALSAMAMLVFAVVYGRIGRYILVQAAVYAPALMALARLFVWRRSEQRPQRLLLLGAGGAGVQVKRLIQQTSVPFVVVAYVDHKPELSGSQVEGIAVFDGKCSLKAYCLDLGIDEVVTCVGGRISDEAMNQLMECLSLDVRVSSFSNFVERVFFQTPVENIRGEWFLQADLELTHPIFLASKRGLDIGVALLGLALFSPLVLLAVIFVKLESRGPAFYTQTRAGLHNRPFRIWKLRSMRQDAEANGPQWAGGADARVTWVGRILRRTRIDEVPQFWNILSGEMSLVGPRPERPEFIAQLAQEIPFYNQRHLVKPGLTGWAQINYPYGASTADALNKLKYDLFYIKYASVALDAQVILRTLSAAMQGAR